MTDQSTREPEEIRRDIESTRVEMGDTVEALAEKADVKTQAQRKAADVQEKVAGARQSAVQKARENPIPVAVAGALVAALILRRIAKH